MSGNRSDYIVEVCCGSYYDARQAFEGGAQRIELNSALALGGLTPATATLCLVKENMPSLKVVAMVRPRGAGFCYTWEEFSEMEAACTACSPAWVGTSWGPRAERGVEACPHP